MNIGICTSFYNGYGKYLDRWLNSVLNMNPLPDHITIVASGKDNGFAFKTGYNESETIALPKVKFIYLPEHISMGHARNEAVKNTESDYVLYLDVDDEIVPNALQIYSNYEGYDVISGGLSIKGDKPNRELIFNASNERQLKGKHCCCSHALYKKELWEKSPYIESNDYIDQPLWIGFAKLGASFIGTKEICTIYNTSKTGHNMSLTPEQKQEALEQKKKLLRGDLH